MVEQASGRGARYLSTYLLRVMGSLAGLFGPAASPLCWKSRRCSAWLGSTCCWWGLAPLRLSSLLPEPLFTDDCTGAEAPALLLGAALLVFGVGAGVGVLRLHAVTAAASESAAASVRILIVLSFLRFIGANLQTPCRGTIRRP